MIRRRRPHAQTALPAALFLLAAAAGCGGPPDPDRSEASPGDAGPWDSAPADTSNTSNTRTLDGGPAQPSPIEAGSAPIDAARAGDAAHSCVTSAAKGSCGPYLYPAITGSDGTNTTVGQDVWNPISGWAQTLHASDPGNWYVTANMPAGNTAVVSFPNTGESYDSSPLSSFSSIVSSYAENMNPTAGTSAEAAYDIWLNDWNNEVMIQHDMFDRGGPCGPVLATVSFGGDGGVAPKDWILCQYGSELIWQVAGQGSRYGEPSGSVDILAMLRWLGDHGGYLPSGSSLTAIGYGFEICSTGGTDEVFEVSSFTIASSR